MEAMSLRRRDTGELLFHFTLDPVELPDEDVFYDGRVWGGYADQEGDDILEYLYGLVILDPDGNELDMDAGDAYTESLVNSFHGTTLYTAELVASPEEVTGDEPPVPV